MADELDATIYYDDDADKAI